MVICDVMADCPHRVGLVGVFPASLAPLAEALVATGRFSVHVRSAVDPALDLVRERGIEALLVDQDIPGGVVSFVRRVARIDPEMRVSVLAADEHESVVLPAVDAGAIGFIPATAALVDIVEHLEDVIHVGASFSPVAAAVVVRARTAEARRSNRRSPAPRLGLLRSA